MNVIGIHENGQKNTAEKPSETVQKELQKTGTADRPYGFQPGFRETEPVTYQEQLLKVSENIFKKEEAQSADEEERWKSTGDRMTEEDCEEISKEGISLEEYNLERLERVLTRIKGQRIQKEYHFERQKEKLEDRDEAVKRMAYYNKGAKEVVDKLIDADLPVTEENIERVQNAMKMAAAASPISDKAATYLIKNRQEPTVENIYKAGYSGSYSERKEISEEVWNKLLGQVKDVIAGSGMEVNEENLESAKWLLNHDLPLTGDTLWALRDLNSISAGLDENGVLDKVVEALSNGMAPESASLGTSADYRIEQSIAAFHSISEEAVKHVIRTRQGQEGSADQINCAVLKDAQNAVEQKDAANREEQGEDSNKNSLTDNRRHEDVDIRTVTVRRQLEEIRLKLTFEAGRRLMKNGIRPDTDSLGKIVEGLKEIEDQYYRNLLKESEAADTGQNIDILRKSMEGIQELKGMPSYILGNTLGNRKLETVSSLLSAGRECRQVLEKAKESYETLMTAPRKDMGDSIAKAFRNVDAILDDMKLETTRANQKAVRILGYNQMEITEENIRQVKAYDAQVNYLMKNLHPAVAVELIKDGINPIDIPIEELSRHIDEIKNELGVSDGEKYSKYLWKLEKEKGISEKEKKSYIGIYRLLNTIEKTDGAALGAVVKANREVTLHNLLTAVRTRNGSGIRADVDDAFGTLEEYRYTDERITEQLAAAFETGSEERSSTEFTAGAEEHLNYMNRLLQNVREELTPARLHALGDTADILNMSAEKLEDSLKDAPDNEEAEQDYWADKAKNYRDTVEQSERALRFLKEFDLPGNLHNIQAANDILSMDQTVYRQWKNLLKKEKSSTAGSPENEEEQMPADISQISEGFLRSLNDRDSMIKQFDEVDKHIGSRLDRFYDSETITSQDIAALQRISNGMSFLRKLATRESYEIPLAVGDSITNVNVTVIRNTGEAGKVDISVNSDLLGRISAVFTVKEQAVNGLITCDNRPGLDALREERENLNEAVTQGGLTVKQLSYGIESRGADAYRLRPANQVRAEETGDTVKETEVSTDRLYYLAKSIVLQVRAIELRHTQN